LGTAEQRSRTVEAQVATEPDEEAGDLEETEFVLGLLLERIGGPGHFERQARVRDVDRSSD